MNSGDKKIRKAFKEKNWNAIKSSDSWQIFKIMSEFVQGFETMSKIGPCVSVFGSARTKPDNKFYKQAEEERGHAMKIFEFVNEAGGAAISPSIPVVNNEFEGLREI